MSNVSIWAKFSHNYVLQITLISQWTILENLSQNWSELTYLFVLASERGKLYKLYFIMHGIVYDEDLLVQQKMNSQLLNEVLKGGDCQNPRLKPWLYWDSRFHPLDLLIFKCPYQFQQITRQMLITLCGGLIIMCGFFVNNRNFCKWDAVIVLKSL